MKVGPYRLAIGKYWVTRNFWLFEISAKGPGLYLDIDWTDDKFPVGWCAALNLGSSDPAPARWHAHWAWNAPYHEPNRINLAFGSPFGPVKVDVSCPTWWREEYEESGEVMPSGCPVFRVRCYRTFPYLEDGWPPVRVTIGG
jgi:hypothetical protein